MVLWHSYKQHGKVFGLRRCSSSPFSDSHRVSALFFIWNEDALQIPCCACRGQEGIPPCPSWSIPATTGAASRHSQGTSLVTTDLILLPSAIHSNHILVLLGAVRGFLGQERVTSPAVGQLAGEQFLLPWPCPALPVPSVPLQKAVPLTVSALPKVLLLCSPARSWWHCLFLPKLSRIFTITHQTSVCHLV